MIKQFGLGLATAVLLAGILVVTLAPAILVLFGGAAWWLPRWLDRILPHISIEGEAQPTPQEAPKEPTPAAPRPLGRVRGMATETAAPADLVEALGVRHAMLRAPDLVGAAR